MTTVTFWKSFKYEKILCFWIFKAKWHTSTEESIQSHRSDMLLISLKGSKGIFMEKLLKNGKNEICLKKFF